MSKKRKNLPSSQKHLNISEIKNDCVVLKNGTLRAVLLVSSINFALKSQEEQKGVINGYIQFLNSIDFPIQILIQSRPFNVTPYLTRLENKKRKQSNELLRNQTNDYINYVQELVELGGIMHKRFYIVVPYNPMGDKKENFFTRFFNLFSASASIRLKSKQFEKYRDNLFKRVDKIISLASSMSLKAVPLDTQSLIELFYSSYNPEESQVQRLANLKELKVKK